MNANFCYRSCKKKKEKAENPFKSRQNITQNSMKRFSLTTMISLFLLLLVTGIQAQTDKKAEELIKALTANDCTTAKLLVKSIESVDYQDKDGNSLLIYSIFLKCEDVIKALLDKGAKLDTKNADGFTALFIASQEGNTEVIKQLIDKGAKLDLQTADGGTALFVASQDGLSKVVKMLIDNGAKLDLQDLNGATPLIIASKNGHTEVVKLLLDKGANFDKQASNKGTALMMASGLGHTEIVKLLLDKGANPDIKFGDDKTALDYAANSEIKNLLTNKQEDTQENNPNAAIQQKTNQQVMPLGPPFMLPAFTSNKNYDCSMAQLLQMMRLPGSSNTMVVRLTAQEGATIIGDPAQMIANIPGSTITINGKIKIVPCDKSSNEMDISIDGDELLFKLNGENRLVYVSGKGSVTINGKRTDL